MTNFSTLLKRTERGVKFLDKTFGRKKWLKKMNVGKLDMGDGNICMIGEIAGDYDKLADDYGITTKQSEQLGFTLDDIWEDAEWDMLTRAWALTLGRLGVKK